MLFGQEVYNELLQEKGNGELSWREHVEVESYRTLADIYNALNDEELSNEEKLRHINVFLFSFETAYNTAKFLEETE